MSKENKSYFTVDKGNKIDINEYIQYDDEDNFKLYFNKDRFLEDALAYIQDDNLEHTIIIDTFF